MDETIRDEVPTTLPIKSVQTLFNWRQKPLPLKERGVTWKFEVDEGLNYDFTKQNDDERAKILVCHDMKGGYLEDRFNNGVCDLNEEPYRFVHWPLIDIFVYFSHHFITIPPYGWIQAAHENGVKVLGTVITEGKPGERNCDRILESDESIDLFVDKCCDIAFAHGFDGWLFNIENKLAKNQVFQMKRLVRKLTDKMHKQVPGSTVLWYDSVTVDGVLKWQDQLNEQNFDFFDACDGIYINYGWKVDESTDGIADSLETLQRHNCEKRRYDVYFGIDVFGRGTFGGGGFNVVSAVLAINDRASVAIFAPGWTMEAKSETESFLERDYRFWKLLENPLRSRSLAARLEIDHKLKVSFCSGSGRAGDRWYLNLKKQKVMPPTYFYPRRNLFTLCHYQDALQISGHQLQGLQDGSEGLFIERVHPMPWTLMGKNEAVPLLNYTISINKDVNIALVGYFQDQTPSLYIRLLGGSYEVRTLSPNKTKENDDQFQSGSEKRGLNNKLFYTLIHEMRDEAIACVAIDAPDGLGNFYVVKSITFDEKPT